MKQGASFAKKQGTLIALACAAAFALPQAAVAQVATPDFSSGKGLTLSVDFLLALVSKISNNATVGIAGNSARRTELGSSSSSVYFKGSEKLDGSVIQGWGFVITWDYDPDEYNRRGANEVSQTIIGMQTPAGAFFFGVNDNPYKQIGLVNVAGTSTFGTGMSQSGTLGTPGFRTSTAKGSRKGDAEQAVGAAAAQATMAFYRLNSNSVNWYSPTWNGLKFYAQWVPGDTDVDTSITSPTQNQQNYSGAVTYANGPFNIGYVYEKRKDYYWGASLGTNTFGRGLGSGATTGGSAAIGAGEHSTDTGQVLTAGYQLGNFKLGGFYQKMEYSQSGLAQLGSVGAAGSTTAGATTLTGTAVAVGVPFVVTSATAASTVNPVNLTDLSVTSWYLGLKWRGGPHEVATFYWQANSYSCNGPNTALVNACQTDSGAKSYGLAYRYTVSKQLRLFTSISRMDNEAHANYSGHSTVRAGAADTVGTTLSNISVGVTGSF